MSFKDWPLAIVLCLGCSSSPAPLGDAATDRTQNNDTLPSLDSALDVIQTGDGSTSNDATPNPDSGSGDSAVAMCQAVVGQACEPHYQTGCPANQGCYPGSASTLACAPAGGGGDGTPCPTFGECRAGTFCLVSNGTQICRPYCCTNTSGSCANGGSCLRLTGFESINLGGCVPACNPVSGSPSGCSGGQACHYNGAGFACTSAGAAGPDQACVGSNGCQAGYGCVNFNGSGICKLYCNSRADCVGGNQRCDRTFGNDRPGVCFPNL